MMLNKRGGVHPTFSPSPLSLGCRAGSAHPPQQPGPHGHTFFPTTAPPGCSSGAPPPLLGYTPPSGAGRGGHGSKRHRPSVGKTSATKPRASFPASKSDVFFPSFSPTHGRAPGEGCRKVVGVIILKRNGQKMGFFSLSDKGKREKSSTPPAEIWGKAGGRGLNAGTWGFLPRPQSSSGGGRGDCFLQ